MLSFILSGFHVDSKGMAPEIGHKDTTIFLSRCHFIEKLTPKWPKKDFSSRQKGKIAGKSIAFSRF